MRKTCILMILLCLLGGSVFAADVLMPADVSCRTDSQNLDTNHHDNSKLSIEVDDNEGAKSWIKFNQLDTIEDPNSIRQVFLRLSLHEDESGENSFDVSAVNDDYTTNIGWEEMEITWNNAPANDTDSFSSPDFTQASLIDTVNLSNAQVGDQFRVDVTSVFEADTDGILQFILHNSTTLVQVATHDHDGGEDYWPTLVFVYPPAGADFPNPEVGEIVTTSLAELSWTNPDPNDGAGPIYCDVYLGTDPNRTDPIHMDKYAVPTADAESVAINTTNFPNQGALQDNTTYYWYVDCWDDGALIPGEEWSFSTYNNTPPYNVYAGEDAVIWLTENNSVTINNATAEDDGLPGPLTVTWTLTAGPETAVIDPNDQLTTTFTFTEAGDYEFTLTADDGDLETTDSVRVVVGEDACDASHIQTGDPYNEADENEDCLVNLLDFVELIANDWLNCTDTLTNCAD